MILIAILITILQLELGLHATIEKLFLMEINTNTSCLNLIALHFLLWFLTEYLCGPEISDNAKNKKGGNQVIFAEVMRSATDGASSTLACHYIDFTYQTQYKMSS